MTRAGLAHLEKFADGRSGPRNTGRPTRDAAATLPDLILDAARELFLTQGFEATSLNQIAARAGVTKRTLYRRFGDKSEIFAAAVRRMLDQRREKLDDPGMRVTPAERLVRFGRSALAVALDPAVLDLCRVVIAEASRFPALAALMEEQITHGVHKHLTELLREEIAEGRLTGDNPALAAELLQIMIVGQGKFDALFGMENWGQARRTKWVEAAVRLFLDGSRARQGHRAG